VLGISLTSPCDGSDLKVILPFTVGVYFLFTHQYNLDPIIALVGYSESTFMKFRHIDEQYGNSFLKCNLICSPKALKSPKLHCPGPFHPRHCSTLLNLHPRPVYPLITPRNHPSERTPLPRVASTPLFSPPSTRQCVDTAVFLDLYPVFFPSDRLGSVSGRVFR
jgi:hypothetical protein